MTGGESSARRQILVPAVVLALAVLAVYWPATGYDFVRWDDDNWIYRNPLLRGGLSPEAVWAAVSQIRLTYWIPVTWLSLLADAQLFGLGPRGFHTVNILWHAANSLLLFWLLRRATGCTGRSWFAAALFALHPLRVESVVWATERKDVLSAFFYLLSLGAYGAHAVKGGRRWYAGSLAAFALGMMAKPSLPTLPVALLALDFWPLRRGTPERSSWLPLLREKVPFAVVSGLFTVLTLASQRVGGSLDAARQPGFGVALEKFFSSYPIYLGKFLLPLNLAPEVYLPPPSPRWELVALTCAVFWGLCLGAVGVARRRPYLAAGWFWYVVTLLPASGLVQFGGQWLGDRYTYLPQIGVVVGLVWWVGERGERSLGGRRIAAAGLLAVLGLAGLTLAQERHWRDTRALFSHALDVSPDNLLAHLMLGILDGEEGRLDSAVAHYRRVLDLAPGHPVARVQLGIALAAQGHLAEAVGELRTLVRDRPGDADAHFNLAVALAQVGERRESIGHYQRAIEIAPRDVRARYNLALLWVESGREERAAEELSRILDLDPAFVEARQLLSEIRSRVP